MTWSVWKVGFLSALLLRWSRPPVSSIIVNFQTIWVVISFPYSISVALEGQSIAVGVWHEELLKWVSLNPVCAMESLARGTIANVSSSFTTSTELLGFSLRGDDLLRSERLGCSKVRPGGLLVTSVSTTNDKTPARSANMGLHTGRDPNVKKPAWLRQRAPQGEKLSKLKESITTLKLNTVCEEAQCPNIGEVRLVWDLFEIYVKCSRFWHCQVR